MKECLSALVWHELCCFCIAFFDEEELAISTLNDTKKRKYTEMKERIEEGGEEKGEDTFTGSWGLKNIYCIRGSGCSICCRSGSIVR